MEQKQRLFIYGRREMGVLVLLGTLVAVFAFTLGVHLGKKVNPKGVGQNSAEASSAATVSDKIPNRQELNEQSRNVQNGVDESLNQAVHDEVIRTGIRLDTPRQIDLPTRAKGEASRGRADDSQDAQRELEIPAAHRPSPDGKFTLQVGSYPALPEAKDQIDALEALGLAPFLRAAEIKGKGKWFRIYIGGYATRDVAEKAGERYRTQHVIEDFIVAPNTAGPAHPNKTD